MAAERAALPSPILVPGTDFAGYVIEEMLARGGMGIVYRATDPALDRTVALKVIAPEHSKNAAAVARFRREAKLAAAIDHPNLVTIYRGGEWEGVLYLAMQFVPGTDLRELLHAKGPQELPWIERIVGQVASALDAAHAFGLVHRDVKPANILLSEAQGDEHAYLTDFGITKRLGASTANLTRPDRWVGTPDYAAPEQIRGLEVDARTDVYSLGCVVHELLTGNLPYTTESIIATLWAHVTDPPPSPCAYRTDLLPVFDVVVARATAKEPGDRFPSAGALAQALSDAVGIQMLSVRQSPDDVTPVASDAAGVPESAEPPPDAATTAALPEGTDPPAKRTTDTLVRSPPPTDGPPASGDHAVRSPAGTSTRGRWAAVAGIGGALVIAAVIAALLLTGNSSSSPDQRPRNTSSSSPGQRPQNTGAATPSLKQQVATLNGIVQLFIAGKRLSHEDQKYSAAAANRTAVLQRLNSFHAPAPLRAATQTLRAMTADSLLFNRYMAAGETSRARGPDNAHNKLRPRFVNEFNPYALRYLNRTYTVGEF